MRLIASAFVIVITTAVIGTLTPAHAVLTTGYQVYDGTDSMNDIANWVFGDCNTDAGQCTDSSTAEADSAFQIFLITGESVDELARWEGGSDGQTIDGLTINGTIVDPSSGEIYAGNWEYSGPDIVGYLVVKAGGIWGLFDYTNSASDPNAGYFDVGCLFALTGANTACNDLDQTFLEGLWSTDYGNNTIRENSMSHVTAYTPLPAAAWLFITALEFSRMVLLP